MAQTNALAALAAFLPRRVLDGVAARAGAPPAPAGERLRGVLLWADVSGFTPLVERLSREGNAGAERLSETLGGHFGRLIQIVERRGGDLLFLAGDGALALWPAEPAELDVALGQALAAGAAIIAELDGQRPQPDVTIHLRVSVAAGPLAAFTVGGGGAHWLDLVAGPALHDLAVAAAEAAPGRIEVAAGTRGLAPRMASPAPAASPPRLPPDLTPAALLPHLLPPVAARLQAGQRDFLAEFRAMTAVFVDLSGLGPELDLDRLQEVTVLLQAATADFGGTVYQLVQDDKGIGAVVVFGLPGSSNEDDPVRAVRFARRLTERLRPLVPGVSAGIATGPVFCGPCGLPHRCQYALFGRPMNRAARLMTAAGEGSRVLLDEETHRAAARRLQLGRARRLTLKGLDGPITAYEGGADEASGPAAAPGLVGRRRERELLASRLDELVRDGRGGVVVLEGPAGIGKTSLLGELRRTCRARRCPLAQGIADFVEGRTPLYALRGVLREFLGVTHVSYPADVAARIDETLGELGENPELSPLLGQALGHALPENDLMRQMTPAIRAENRNRLLLALVALAARRRRWVAVLDDLHWSDAATAALLPQLAEVAGILWVFATRPDGSAADVLGKLAARGAAAVRLDGLGGEEVAALAAATLGLGAGALPAALTALLAERGQGNPLYCRELALALRETGRITVEDGRCALAPSFRPEAARDLPDSLYALIKSRIDRLSPGPLLALRVGSVIGQWFERRVLARVLPDEAPAALDGHLRELVQQGFLREEPRAAGDADGGGRFAFGHATVQAVAYELFPDKQRARLHRTTAEALEEMHGQAAPEAVGRLSHHWNEAGDPQKATEYSTLAARQALDGYANRDAIDLSWRALRNQEAWRGVQEIDVERANLYALQAQAHYSLTQPREARVAFEAALRHAGYTNPGGAAGVLGGIARHLLARATGRAALEASGEERARRLAALSILAEWITLDFWEGRVLEGAAKAFMGHRLAAAVLSSPLAADAVARLGYVLAMTPFRFLAEGELLRAVALSERSGDLQALASSRVLLGMFYTLSGRAAAALAPLEAAQPPAEKLGAGLWRHRTRFMLGETLLCLGRLEEARAAFEDAANLSAGAEPPLVGMSTSMAALAVARLGRHEEALALLEGPKGLPLISGGFLPLQRFASLGAKIEVLARLGRLDEALVVAREAQAMAARGQDCDTFFAGIHGHAAVAEAYLDAWDRARAGGASQAVLARLRADGRAACARLAKFAGLYPAARPRSDALRGRWLAQGGRAAAARRALGRARRAAHDMALPWETAVAQRWLAEVDEPVSRPHAEGSR